MDDHRKVHAFDNGVKVYDDHLIAVQRERYRRNNVHEANEEHIFTRLIQSLPTNACFVNIGAAVGYYPLLAKKMKPALTIHAVEPNAQNRTCFKENINLNGFDKSDFHIHSEVISNSGGLVDFHAAGYTSVIHTGEFSLKNVLRRILYTLGFKRYDPGSVITAESITLSKLLNRLESTADLVQMDIQGFEAEVLRSSESVLQGSQVKTFLIGTHGNKTHFKCVTQLRNNGYSIEYSEPEPEQQPDGIIVASKGVNRLGGRDKTIRDAENP